jgi:hypothetical protein
MVCKTWFPSKPAEIFTRECQIDAKIDVFLHRPEANIDKSNRPYFLFQAIHMGSRIEL